MPVTLSLRASFLLSCALCAASIAPLAMAAPPTPAVADRASGMSGDTLTATLAGEYALQAGRLDEAADWYLKAAQSADGDAGLAERATRIGLLTGDNARSAKALALWQARAASSVAMLASDLTLSLRRNDLPASLKTLKALLRDPAPEATPQALVALNTGARDPATSAKLIGQLLDDDAIPSGNLQTWLALGGLAQRLGEGGTAERIVGEIIERFPGEPRVALLRASQLREAGKPDEARAALQPVADNAATALIPELRLAVAAEYDALGDNAAAAVVLSRGPQDDQTWRLRAGLLARAEDTAGLASLYDALKRESTVPDPARRLLLGQVAEYLKRTDEALTWYASVPGGPQRAQARLRTAKLMHDSKRIAEAYRDLRDIQSDAALDDEARMGGYLLEAELRLADKDAAGELDAYARGLAAYPDAGELLYARGLMWERRDDIPRAEADLRRILVAEPDNVGALNALGYTLADRTTRYAEALELIDRARVAEPDNAAIVDSYGWVLYRLGRNDDALAALRRAFALQKDPEIAAHLGEVLWVIGRKDEARKYFAESQKLEPDNRSLKRALATTGA